MTKPIRDQSITMVLASVVLAAAFALPALADFSVTYNSGFANGGLIPDGSTIGTADARNLTTVPFNTIQDVNVRLNISGGYNGDLYVYLVHNSQFAILLNRVGRDGGRSFGYGDGGLNVTFDDQAPQSTDIHFYQTVAGYNNSMIQGGTAWRPDGCNVSPLTGGATLAATTPTATLDSFYRLDPNGTWTIAAFDVSSGAQATITSWGLDIVAAVPEPASILEGSFGALFLGGVVVIYRVKSRKLPPAKFAAV